MEVTVERTAQGFSTDLDTTSADAAIGYRQFMCLICGYIYDEENGDPTADVAPGTRWEDLPDSWVCPECGAPKSDFEEVSVA